MMGEVPRTCSIAFRPRHSVHLDYEGTRVSRKIGWNKSRVAYSSPVIDCLLL